MERIKDIFPQRLRQLREYRGLSTTELGEKIGKSQQFISKLEKGANNGGARPSLETLEDLARALNVKISYFFEDNPSYGPQTPLEKLLKQYDNELRDWIVNEAKPAYILLGKRAQEAGLTEEEAEMLTGNDLKVFISLLKSHK